MPPALGAVQLCCPACPQGATALVWLAGDRTGGVWALVVMAVPSSSVRGQAEQRGHLCGAGWARPPRRVLQGSCRAPCPPCCMQRPPLCCSSPGRGWALLFAWLGE